MAARNGTSRAPGSPQSETNEGGASNPIDQFLEWLETLDVPPLTRTQRAMVYFCALVIVTVIITSLTGHFYVVALAFAEAIDSLSTGVLTALVVVVVIVLEVIGMNTTLMALVVGYIYSRRIEDKFEATMVASLVSYGGICIGCIAAYALGATLLKDWALELQRRNPIFEALDLVLETKGLTVNLLLRLTMPDILINFAMACSRCSFVNFVGGFIAMIPWIVLHAWYGTTIENLTDGTPDEGDGEVITLVVGIVATASLSAVLVVYTKRILEGMVNEEQERQHLETGRGGGESRGGVQLPDGVRRTPIASLA